MTKVMKSDNKAPKTFIHYPLSFHTCLLRLLAFSHWLHFLLDDLFRLLDVIQFPFTLFAFLAVLFHMCLLRLLDVVELLFTLVAFITKGKHDMELVRLTALAKALGLVHPEIDE